MKNIPYILSHTNNPALFHSSVNQFNLQLLKFNISNVLDIGH